MNDGASLLILAALIYGAFALLPVFIGVKRRIELCGLMAIISLLLSWSLLIWVMCMCWAIFGRTKHTYHYTEEYAPRTESIRREHIEPHF
jgi:hypothetical protein